MIETVAVYQEQKSDDDRPIHAHVCQQLLFNKSSSEDEIANVNVLRRYRTCRDQSLRPLN